MYPPFRLSVVRHLYCGIVVLHRGRIVYEPSSRIFFIRATRSLSRTLAPSPQHSYTKAFSMKVTAPTDRSLAIRIAANGW